MPERAVGIALGIGNSGLELGQIPVEQQFHFDQKCVHIVSGQPVVNPRLDRQHFLQLVLVQFGEQVGRHLVARFNWCRRVAIDDEFVAEILYQQQSGFAVSSEDGRCRESASRKASAMAMNGVTFSAR